MTASIVCKDKLVETYVNKRIEQILELQTKITRGMLIEVYRDMQKDENKFSVLLNGLYWLLNNNVYFNIKVQQERITLSDICNLLTTW
jgi:hypothetical protein